MNIRLLRITSVTHRSHSAHIHIYKNKPVALPHDKKAFSHSIYYFSTGLYRPVATGFRRVPLLTCFRLTNIYVPVKQNPNSDAVKHKLTILSRLYRYISLVLINFYNIFINPHLQKPPNALELFTTVFHRQFCSHKPFFNL
jgi:hypothetical protein